MSKRSRQRKFKQKRNTEFDASVWTVFVKIIMPLFVLAASLLFAWVLLR